MADRSLKILFLAAVLLASLSQTLCGQDKVYFTDGRVQYGKVSDITAADIKFAPKDRPQGVVYYLPTSQLDSIVYANGTVDLMQAVLHKRKLMENIPQRNTWSFDILGLSYLSLSQSFEHRTESGIVGLRVPFYLGFVGGGFAGEGIFQPNQGLYPILQNNSKGFSIASGFNPRFYLFKRRKVRAFIGPEATVGYGKSIWNPNSYYSYYNTDSYLRRYGTVSLMVKAGLMLHPTDKFNMAIEGGVGGGDMFGSSSALGLVGLWHIGLAFGTNF